MRVRNNGCVYSPSGECLTTLEQSVYLGGLLSTKVDSRPEVTRRLGEAKRVFQSLAKCWSHANITMHRKMHLFQAIVLPKLLYNLESLWLLQADRNRLDAFQAACLRKILKVPHAYYSRVSNEEVRAKAKTQPLSADLLDRQTKLYDRIADLPGDNLLRRLVCEPGSRRPKKWYHHRRRGRPKLQWAASVFQHVPLQ